MGEDWGAKCAMDGIAMIVGPFTLWICINVPPCKKLVKSSQHC